MLRTPLDPTDLGARLDQARRDAGRSREQVCAALDITINTWSSYVKGTTPISAVQVAQLAEFTGKTFGWFAGEAIPAKRQLDQAVIAHLVAEIAAQRSRLDEFEAELVAVSGTAVGDPVTLDEAEARRVREMPVEAQRRARDAKRRRKTGE